MKLLRLIAFTLFALVTWAIAPSAHAQVSCSATASDMVFNPVNPLASQADSTSSVNWTCSNTSTTTRYVKLCFSIGFSGTPRNAASTSGSTAQYNLYTDAARTQVWGSMYWAGTTPGSVNLAVAGRATTTGTLPMYGRVVGGQTAILPGTTFQDGMTGTQTQITYAMGTSPPTTCGTFIAGSAGQFPFYARIVTASQCQVNAATLNFGSVGLLTAAVNGTSSLSIQCTNTTPYNVGLDAGQNAGGNLANRKMIYGGNSVTYQLYRDAARTSVWGATVGTNTVSGTGTGVVQSMPVYGRVAPQTTPPPATYQDIITVTVTY